MESGLVLVINPGSTSTKVSIFKEEELLKATSINHSLDELKKFEDIPSQLDYRLELIYDWLEKENIDKNSFVATVGRGGMLRPIPGGVYKISEKMIDDLYLGVGGEHASNLGGILAKSIGDSICVDSYIVDPVAVDEIEDIARVSGLSKIERRSSAHALNIKAVSHKRADELHKKIEDLNLIVAHLGGGISVCPIKNGKIIDVNNANEMGPFSPERTGSLPVGDLLKMCYSKKYTYEEMNRMIKGQGGLMSYLNTNDGRIVEEEIKSGNSYAKLIYDAMIYQIAKEIAAMATVLKGDVENIILTGGLSYSDYLVGGIKEYISFIGDVVVYPGEDEMESLNKGVLRVLNKEEEPKNYDEVIFND